MLDGERLLCDPGFGMSLLRPLPMVDGAEDDYLPGWQHRLRRTDDGAWAVHRLREAGGRSRTRSTSCRSRRSTW